MSESSTRRSASPLGPCGGSHERAGSGFSRSFVPIASLANAVSNAAMRSSRRRATAWMRAMRCSRFLTCCSMVTGLPSTSKASAISGSFVDVDLVDEHAALVGMTHRVVRDAGDVLAQRLRADAVADHRVHLATERPALSRDADGVEVRRARGARSANGRCHRDERDEPPTTQRPRTPYPHLPRGIVERLARAIPVFGTFCFFRMKLRTPCFLVLSAVSALAALGACGGAPAPVTPPPAVTAPPSPVAIASSTPATRPPPVPVAHRPVTHDYWGTHVTDDFEWLEDGKNPEVTAFTDAQNAHARSVLDGLAERAPVRARVAQLLGASSADYLAVRPIAGSLFVFVAQPPKQQAVLVMRAESGEAVDREGRPRPQRSRPERQDHHRFLRRRRPTRSSSRSRSPRTAARAATFT